jgi:serine/threonine protein kinase
MTANEKTILCVKDKYNLIIRIGIGSFGEVWLADDKKYGKECAIKTEKNTTKSRLDEEYVIYKKLLKNGMTVGIPKVKELIKTPDSNFLVMELLGSSLDQMLNESTEPFDLSTILKLAIVIIGLLRDVHNSGFVHRDIKPNNFLVGGKGNDTTLYIMDFGLAKQYINSNGEHITLRTNRNLVGTARFTSCNIHDGFEPSRRDDLISTGYMLVYFFHKKLPWQGLQKHIKKTPVEVIGDVKLATKTETLCSGLPHCFVEYLNYCKKLKFSEKPNYDYLQSLFVQTAEQLKIPIKYYWE